MKVLGIVGPTDSATRLRDRLADHLGEHGQVGTIKRLSDETDSTPRRDDCAAVTYELADGEDWVAAGESLSLSETLDRLAVDHDYVVVTGHPEARIPQVVLGDRDDAGTALVEASDAESVDVDEVLDALAREEPYETLGSLVRQVKQSPKAERAGAIATFTGRVRARDSNTDPQTVRLEFEKYEGVADDRLETIRQELTERDDVQEVLLHHRTGVIEDGEDIVFVVVLAGHREEAFATVQDGINRLKDEVPIFKKEITVDEEFWIHDKQ